MSATAPKHCAGPRNPPVECSAAVRYTPYAAALDQVLRQEACVARELRSRNWDELSDELADWQKYVRRLAGAADTSHDPAALRGYCATLQEHIDTMRRASRSRDVDAVATGLDELAPVLNRLSNEFPLTELAAPGSSDAES